jgi:hypothetical protein
MPNTNVTVDLSRIGPHEFDPDRPLRVATVLDGVVIDQKVVVPAKERNPRNFAVQLSLGEPQDGVAGAKIVVAPADDERNLASKLAASKFVAGSAEIVDGGTLHVNPSLYRWWRFCWFPRTYHITGRILRHVDDCAHPVGGAQVEIFDVDYCWWWFSESLLTTGTTDVNGFFDITFTWCVPLWCILEFLAPPIIVDPILRERIYAILKERVVVKWPPPPPPDPLEWQRQLGELGIEVPATSRPSAAGLRLRERQTAARRAPVASRPTALSALAVSARPQAGNLNAAEIFHDILFWPPCDDPCDWLPDIKIRVTQNQPSGTVVIYEDSYWQIHFDLDTDLLNLALEANSNALYQDDCHPDPILGNCMLLDAVGTIQIMPAGGDPLAGIYQTDVTVGASYGVTPDRNQRLGYVRDYDRPWAGTPGIHGRFGIAAHVDYYQVQCAKWTNADLLAWDADHTYVPSDAAFAMVPVSVLGSFVRSYVEESPLPLHWASETFAPHTVSGIPGLIKSRERFEQEYRDAHGGNDPAPDFGGWYWYYFTETRLFDLDTGALGNGLYTFRLVCYRQTGVDGMGNPILALVNMGLPGGVGRRCTTSKPELLTLYLHDTVHVPDCQILTFKKNGVDVIDECAMVTLTHTDWIEMEYQAFDASGNLDSYEVTLQRGFDPEENIMGLAGVTAVSGSVPQGPTYGAALADLMTPAIPPYWNGGSWKKHVAYSTFQALGGSCAYNLRVRAWDRHTNGYASGPGWGETECDKNRAFTIILA